MSEHTFISTLTPTVSPAADNDVRPVPEQVQNKQAIQLKLSVGAANDPLEKEADDMADKVMRREMPSPINPSSAKNSINRKCADCEEEEKPIQRKETSGKTVSVTPPIVHDVINSSRGRSLDTNTRFFMESRFNYDFSNVKIHDGNLAAKSASSINALAYTSGNRIVFNAGQYNTSSDTGKRLLAHELTHVIQQGDSINRLSITAGTQNNSSPKRKKKNGSDTQGDLPKNKMMLQCQTNDVLIQRQVSGSADLQSPRFSPSAKLERCFDDIDRLGPGDPDTDAVMRIQQALIDVQAITGNTYDLGSSGPNNDGVDGDYGPKTAAAVKKFKSDETLGSTQFGDVGPGTMHRLDELFTAQPTPPGPNPTPPPTPNTKKDPVFTVQPSPAVSVVKEGKDNTQSTLQVIFTNGSFTIDATVNVQTSQASDADDWQVGVVQMVAGPVNHACYKIPPGSTAPVDQQHARQVFVDALNAPGVVHPDRESGSSVFMNDSFRAGVDLKSIHQSRLFFPVKLHAEDHVSTRAKGSASAVSKEAEGSRASVFRTVRFGFMITNVVARQMSTGRIVPLHTVEWLVFSRVNYSLPGGGLPFDVQNKQDSFQLLKNKPASADDFPPSTQGTSINELERTSRNRSWQSTCPDL